MIKNCLFIFAFVIFGLSCSKTKRDCDAYWISKMKEKWMMLSNCTPEFKHYLAKGIYEAKGIYYTGISCITCKFPPPEFVINCAGDSIRVNNWSDVSDTKIIATCHDF